MVPLVVKDFVFMNSIYENEDVVNHIIKAKRKIILVIAVNRKGI